MNKIKVCSIQRLCLHDGPGIRTTVFLHGCYLDCPWCCNPETKDCFAHYNLWDKTKCVNTVRDITSVFCKGCDKKLNSACPFGALSPTHIEYDPDVLLKHLTIDRKYYADSGGGVTFSGGEPLMQGMNLRHLLEQIKDNGINIVFETSLYAPFENLQMIAEYVDHFIVDVKSIAHPFIAEKYSDTELPFERNLSYVSQLGKFFTLRMILIPGITITEENIVLFRDLAEHYAPAHIELLEYHTLALNKYAALSVPMPEFEKPSDENVAGVLREIQAAHYLKL